MQCFHNLLKERIDMLTEQVIIYEFNERLHYLKQHYYGLVFSSYREFDIKRITSDVLAMYENH